MNATVIVMPGSPALIPALAPSDAAGSALSVATSDLAAKLITENSLTGVDVVSSRDQRWATARTGSLAAWGAPGIDVGKGNHLAELVARFTLRELEVPIVDTREHVGVVDDSRLTVVVLDGSAGLTKRAPLSLIDTAPEIDSWCRGLLAGDDVQVRSEEELLQAGVLEPAGWMELQEKKKQCEKATLVTAEHSTGVGRYLAHWQLIA